MKMLADNIVHFSRILRDTGMAVGPDRVLAAIAAVEAVGLERREDIRAALSAVMLERHEQQTVFDAAFDAFFRDPKLLEQMMYLLLPKIQGRGEKQLPPRANRLAEALAPPTPERKPNPANETAKEEIQFETEFSFSERERLAQADFESMTTAEYELAKKLAERAPLPVQPVRRRRHEAGTRGTLDLRRTLQGMARQPHTLAPAFTHPRTELPPIVVLLDISGSMDRYSRLFLHYVHGLTRRHLKVHTFTFGTRLTNITRCLRHRDPDVALKMADTQVHDWKGGTRIASSLDEFNRRWARRVLGANAAVLLVTDGLERDEGGLLAGAAAQLHRMAHEVVWLNPLLRFDGFEPRAEGIRTLLAHVDRFLPVHNLASLADLAGALQRPALQPSSLLH
ncbi:VWA domain-containing protein [Rhizobacter sp. AJA081-3]|uniref:vWA domain-containing protein n=1 Tax=Rhizobacter sp. AJA081-3 TaxID=2753607 RepID=UPI001AE0780A|nr:VWA domain-containing protein [Rhizobacter sp. AJA081-3]QTN21694.1 VWA domain-containing protein [Rhizobacter sp. AJA081-3]